MNCPDLYLVTGSHDHVWEPCISAEHPAYKTFLGAYLFQGDWGYRQWAWFWDTHLQLWPRKSDGASKSRQGLVAQRVAEWMRAGYSQKQISQALGYASPSKRLWEAARDYEEWLTNNKVRAGGVSAQVDLEDALAAGAATSIGADTGPFISPQLGEVEAPSKIDATRRQFREAKRCPRVVDLSAYNREQVGFPEHFSERLLYPDLDPIRRQVDAAQGHLEKLEPYHASKAA